MKRNLVPQQMKVKMYHMFLKLHLGVHPLIPMNQQLLRKKLQCQKKRCIMYHSHALSNTKRFQKIGEDYLCRSCNQFVSRMWCGTRKIMEYNTQTETLPIWHQGKHRYQVKPGCKTVEQKQKVKEMLVYIMRQYPKCCNIA